MKTLIAIAALTLSAVAQADVIDIIEKQQKITESGKKCLWYYENVTMDIWHVAPCNHAARSLQVYRDQIKAFANEYNKNGIGGNYNAKNAKIIKALYLESYKDMMKTIGTLEALTQHGWVL